MREGRSLNSDSLVGRYSCHGCNNTVNERAHPMNNNIVIVIVNKAINSATYYHNQMNHYYESLFLSVDQPLNLYTATISI